MNNRGFVTLCNVSVYVFGIIFVNYHNIHITQPFYGHYVGQPVLAGTPS